MADLATTGELLARIRQGDRSAENALIRRYLPVLTRLAHGRLPHDARDLKQTEDLVSETLASSLGRLNGFEVRRKGGFLAYLHRALLRRVIDEIRRVRRRPTRVELDTGIADLRRSVIEQVVGREMVESYEAALAKLPQKRREAVVLRLEFGYSHQEIAHALGMPSEGAARGVVARALVHIVKAMDEFRT